MAATARSAGPGLRLLKPVLPGCATLAGSDTAEHEDSVVQVEIPRRYRLPTQGRSRIDVEGHTVRECIEAVEAQCPGFGELIFDAQGNLSRFARLFVNGDEVMGNSSDPAVGDGDCIQILTAAAGG